MRAIYLHCTTLGGGRSLDQRAREGDGLFESPEGFDTYRSIHILPSAEVCGTYT